MSYRFLLIVTCCWLFSSMAYGYVMGEDNRLEADDEQERLTAIHQTGMIRIEGEEFVTGLVTGDNCDVVISAGHAAIYWQSISRKGWRKGDIRGQGKFLFTPTPDVESSWQALTLISSGYEDSENLGKDEHDWSIFRLDRPAMSKCENIQLIENDSVCKDGLVMVGFHFDKPKAKLLDESCELRNRTKSGMIVHDCDSKDGSSGSPLFCFSGSRFALLAINVSGLTRKDYFDSGVHGDAGLEFSIKQHKNFALYIGGSFKSALMKELHSSMQRRVSN